jgi:tRNA-dihydrouridine synthase
MISDKGIHFRNKKTLEMLFVDPSEHPASVQIFGGSKETLVEAAQFVAENTNTDIIDINMKNDHSIISPESKRHRLTSI